MTGNQMIISFLQYYDRITNFSAKGYETPEVLLFLNNSQDQFIKDKAYGKNFQPPALEDNAKRVADLRLLTKTVISTVSAQSASGLYRGTVPVDMAYHISAKLRMTRTNPTMTLETVECEFIKTDHADKFIHSSANRTYHLRPVVFLNEGYFYVQCDYYVSAVATTGFTLAYIRIPDAILATDDEVVNFPAHAHQEIVEMAVDTARGAGREQKSQIEVVEQQTKTK